MVSTVKTSILIMDVLGRYGRLGVTELSRMLELPKSTVHRTLLKDGDVLYVDCVESRTRLRTYSVIGLRAPLYCTSVGKAILAFQPNEYIQRTSNRCASSDSPIEQ